VCLTVNDGTLSSSQSALWRGLRPERRFVTGGGWIESPAGAYIADPTLAGRATFGFMSKYQKGSNLPTGNTAFQFDLAGWHLPRPATSGWWSTRLAPTPSSRQRLDQWDGRRQRQRFQVHAVAGDGSPTPSAFASGGKMPPVNMMCTTTEPTSQSAPEHRGAHRK